MKLVEFHGQYKHGPLAIKTRGYVIAPNIVTIEALPEEAPEHQDGIRSLMTLSSMHRILLLDDYHDLIERWKAALL